MNNKKDYQRFSMRTILFHVLLWGLIGVGVMGAYTYFIAPQQFTSSVVFNLPQTKAKEAMDKVEEQYQNFFTKEQTLRTACDTNAFSKTTPNLNRWEKEIHLTVSKQEVKLTCVASNPILAYEEATALAKVGQKEQKLSVQKAAQFQAKPSQPHHLKQLIFGGLVGAILAFIIGSFRFLIRKKIYGEMFVKTLAAPVIGKISTLPTSQQENAVYIKGGRQVSEENEMVDTQLIHEMKHMEHLTRSRRQRH